MDWDDDERSGQQQENLDRVSARIGRAILDFCRAHKRFYAEELRSYVIRVTPGKVAPGSADRVLRDLRQRHVLNYRVLSRRESLYEMISIGGVPVEDRATPPATPPTQAAASL